MGFHASFPLGGAGHVGRVEGCLCFPALCTHLSCEHLVGACGKSLRVSLCLRLPFLFQTVCPASPHLGINKLLPYHSFLPWRLPLPTLPRVNQCGAGLLLGAS